LADLTAKLAAQLPDLGAQLDSKAVEVVLGGDVGPRC
jgi:hypothetical protein